MKRVWRNDDSNVTRIPLIILIKKSAHQVHPGKEYLLFP